MSYPDNVHRAPFGDAHRSLDLCNTPIGQQIAKLQGDVEYLAMEYAERGELLDSALHMVRGSVERLEMFSTLLTARAELEEYARRIGRMITELGDSRHPGSVEKARHNLAEEMGEVESFAARSIT